MSAREVFLLSVFKSFRSLACFGYSSQKLSEKHTAVFVSPDPLVTRSKYENYELGALGAVLEQQLARRGCFTAEATCEILLKKLLT